MSLQYNLKCLDLSREPFARLEPIDCEGSLEVAWLGQGRTILSWLEISCKIEWEFTYFVLVCTNLFSNFMAGFPNRSQHQRHLTVVVGPFGTFFSSCCAVAVQILKRNRLCDW
jgi:hypothetical protein